MSIKELLSSGQNVTIAVTPADLKEFALSIVEELRSSMETERATDRRLTIREAADQLGVTVQSLYRWNRSGYLSPAGHIGQKPFYLQSQIDAIR